MRAFLTKFNNVYFLVILFIIFILCNTLYVHFLKKSTQHNIVCIYWKCALCDANTSLDISLTHTWQNRELWNCLIKNQVSYHYLYLGSSVNFYLEDEISSGEKKVPRWSVPRKYFNSKDEFQGILDRFEFFERLQESININQILWSPLKNQEWGLSV